MVTLIACTNTVEGGSESLPTNDATEQIDADKLCDLLMQCTAGTELTLEECRRNFKVARFTAACADAVADVTSCSGGATTCNSDGTVTGCTANGRAVTADCAAGCASENMTWTGACGTSFGGETAESVKCWCE
jgi:hypothetical protein